MASTRIAATLPAVPYVASLKGKERKGNSSNFNQKATVLAALRLAREINPMHWNSTISILGTTSSTEIFALDPANTAVQIVTGGNGHIMP